jgi:hypothetical protein
LVFCGRVGAATAIRKSNLILRGGFSNERFGKKQRAVKVLRTFNECGHF